MKIRLKKNWVKKSIRLAAGMLPVLFVLISCGNAPMVSQDDSVPGIRPMDEDSVLVKLRQPGLSKGLSGIDSLKRDSVTTAVKKLLRENIEKQFSDLRGTFSSDYFNGYFITDLDNDGFSEVWIKTGHNRQNSRLQLFYPQLSGEWKVSTMAAEPGEYYLGDGYVIQIVTAGAGVISKNKLSINRYGEMEIDNEMEIDQFETPEKKIPKPAEKSIKDIKFSNLTPLRNAL